MQQSNQAECKQGISKSRTVRIAKRTQRLGYLVIGDQPGSLPCTVREFSEEGAILSMSGWMGVPDQFTLFVEPDSVRVDCQVLKKRGSKVQVAFSAWENDVRYRARAV